MNSIKLKRSLAAAALAATAGFIVPESVQASDHQNSGSSNSQSHSMTVSPTRCEPDLTNAGFHEGIATYRGTVTESGNLVSETRGASVVDPENTCQTTTHSCSDLKESISGLAFNKAVANQDDNTDFTKIDQAILDNHVRGYRAANCSVHLNLK